MQPTQYLYGKDNEKIRTEIERIIKSYGIKVCLSLWELKNLILSIKNVSKSNCKELCGTCKIGEFEIKKQLNIFDSQELNESNFKPI